MKRYGLYKGSDLTPIQIFEGDMLVVSHGALSVYRDLKPGMELTAAAFLSPDSCVKEIKDAPSV